MLTEFKPDYDDDPEVLHGVIKDMFETIYNLQDENKRLKAELEQHRWIPVSEGLPEQDSCYMTLIRYSVWPEMKVSYT